MRAARLMFTAAVVSVALAGCSEPAPAPPTGPPPTSAVPSATTSTDPEPKAGTAPLSQVVAAVESVAGHMMGKISTPGGIPIDLEVSDGEVLGTDVGDDVEVVAYEVYSAESAPAFRVCLGHSAGPWAAFDSGVGELVTGLNGECVYSAADQPASRTDLSLSPDKIAKLEPRTIEELSWVLTSAVSTLGAQLGEEAATDLPEDLTGLVGRDDLAPAHPDVSITGYEVHPPKKNGRGPGSFVVCVSADIGGWARFDSADSAAALFGVHGECETGDVPGFTDRG